jgi:plasmid stabilization system protein ParE
VPTAEKFINKFNGTLKKIMVHPTMFKCSESHPYLRKAKINTQNSIIYHLDDNETVIIRIIDNRSDHNY